MTQPHQAETDTIHLAAEPGDPPLCGAPEHGSSATTVATWAAGLDMTAATSARVCRDCADEARRLHAE